MSDDQGHALTRRALREQRQAGEAARAARAGDSAEREQPAMDADPDSTVETSELDRVARANRSRRAADVPFDMVPERGSGPERGSLQRARDREALRARRALEAQQQAAPAPGEDPAPLTRRQLRLQALAAAKAASDAHGVGAGDESTDARTNTPTEGSQATPPAPDEDTVDSLSVEEALAARRQLTQDQQAAADAAAASPAAAEAEGPAHPGEKPAGDNDDTGLMDLEVLARQRELAARAAIIRRRVAERERLQRTNADRSQQVQSDPFTGAMDRLRVEQAEKDLANTGVHGPQTNGFRIEMPSRGRAPHDPAAPGPRTRNHGEAVLPPASVPQSAGTDGDAAGRESQDPAHGPVRATSAQGLDPLDYLTAGVRRVNTWTWVVIGALAVGAAGLVTGIVLISTNG